MKNFKKIDLILISILFAFIIGFVLYLRTQGLAFGSNVDWFSQHVAIPDYLRTLFYDDGRLLPLFLPHLGLGQNSFYFAYHGLLSPIILISYLLPFVAMSTYIQIATVISMMISTVLCYKWIKNNFNKKHQIHIAFACSIVFVLAGPLLYHAHRHIMFMVYMPFLMWSLIAVDDYFKHQKRVPLIISTFLLIMTSYYFSVGGILVVGLYALYKTLQTKKLRLVSFKPLAKVIFFVGVGVLLAGFFLLPTIYTIFNGRASTTIGEANPLSLLIPYLRFNSTFYNSYALGMTFIYVIALVHAFMTKKKENIMIAGVLTLCMVIPFISFILNGFLYVDGKSFIPFIPLAILMIGLLINDLFNKKVEIKKLLLWLIPVVIIFVISARDYDQNIILFTDIVLCLSILIALTLWKKPILIYLPIIVIGFWSFHRVNLMESYPTLSLIREENNPAYRELLKSVGDNFSRTSIHHNNILNKANRVFHFNQRSSSIYASISNQNYLEFVRNIFQNEVINRDFATITQTSNLLFNMYAGTRYLIAEEPLIGYELVKTIDGISLFRNEDVLPFGYATSRLMSLRDFNNLSYPHKLEALLNYTIVNREVESNFASNFVNINNRYTITNYENLNFEEIDGIYHITARGNATLEMQLDSINENDIIVVSFDMLREREGWSCAQLIRINGIANALSCSDWKYHNNNFTFNYVLANQGITDTLTFQFNRGEFELGNFSIYKINYEHISGVRDYVDEFIVNTELSTNNRIVGNIDVEEDGFFKVSIPFENNGFTIRLNGQEVRIHQIDTAFIGFPITEGSHEIEIEFIPPMLTTGIITSIIGFIILMLVVFYKKIQKPIDFVLDKSKKLFIIIFFFLKNLIYNNRGVIYLFASLFILDFALRGFYFDTVNYFGLFRLVPNLFSAVWILAIILLAQSFTNKIGKTIYLIFYIFSLVMFTAHTIYFDLFRQFFDYSSIAFAGAGMAYIGELWSSVTWWLIPTAIISILLTVIGLKTLVKREKICFVRAIAIPIIFVLTITFMPYLLGAPREDANWDDWRNPRNVYDAFNDNNKSMMIAGMFQFNFRNFYVNFIRDNMYVSAEERELLDQVFNNAQLAEHNNFTGIFEGKNLIIVKLESIEHFQINRNDMPITHNLMRNSMNFTNHFSFASQRGATFNSEFMINVGFSNPFHYNKNAPAFSRNYYSHSLPNMLRNHFGMTANAFHMNTAEYYSRGLNYRTFGFDNYFSLRDQGIYENSEYLLDRQLILNEEFRNNIFQQNSYSIIITYTAHMPFNTRRGTCPMLTDRSGLTEEECMRIQAAETDKFVGLLLEGLEEHEMLDNTVLVFVTDHYSYGVQDRNILARHGKDINTHLSNHTPFFIWQDNNHRRTIRHVTSQIDILPTILNLFGVPYYPNFYLGYDALDPSFDPVVFFPDGSWWNGETFVARGEFQFGRNMREEDIHEMNARVRERMTLNDAVLKSDIFRNLRTSNS